MSRAAEAPLLVRLPNWLGDLVLAWPVVDAAALHGAVFAGPEPFRALVEPRYPGSAYVDISRAHRFAAASPIRRLKPRADPLDRQSDFGFDVAPPHRFDTRDGAIALPPDQRKRE